MDNMELNFDNDVSDLAVDGKQAMSESLADAQGWNKSAKKPTDKELILSVLSDKKWHNVLEIITRCKPGCINWSVRSRISDLNRDGWAIESRIGGNRQAEYRLGDGQYGKLLNKNIRQYK